MENPAHRIHRWKKDGKEHIRKATETAYCIEDDKECLALLLLYRSLIDKAIADYEKIRGKNPPA